MRTTDKYVFFWQGEFSNWYGASFELGGNIFSNSEQAFMWLKAVHFKDEEIANDILMTPDPKAAKTLGRKVKGFDSKQWEDVCENLMWIAVNAKFRADPRLQKLLVDTGDRILVEASPYDTIWGIGMAETDEGIEDEKNWKGKNLLGKVLMEVRKGLQ